jgi:hypothetical protein
MQREDRLPYQLTGIPTYLMGGLSGLRFVGGDSWVNALLVALPLLVIYDLVYRSIFPDYAVAGKKENCYIFSWGRVLLGR